MKRMFLAIVVVMASIVAKADIPENYYSSIDGLAGKDNLLNALYSRISSHTDVGYDGLYDVYDDSDMKGGVIWDVYSTCASFSKGQCGSYQNVCDCYNREHTTPQSWFSCSGPKSDAFQVLHTDGKVNGQRSNYPYGECAEGVNLGENALGRLGSSTFDGYTGKVFEPDDEYKGDIARICFYMVACYRKGKLNSSEGTYVYTYSNSTTDFTDYAMKLFLKWHRQDPVSQKELDRNDAVYGHQKNRNPFVDYPCLAEYIWGDKAGQTLVLDDLMTGYDANFFSSDQTGCNCTPTSPTIQEPKKSTTIAVGSANVNETVSKQVKVSGALLTANVTLSVSGANASFFSVSPATLTAAAVNAGAQVTISYRPTATGDHTAVLILASDGATSVSVNLTGESKAALVSPSGAVNIISYVVGEAFTEPIFVKGTNLTKDLAIALSGTDANKFGLSTTTMTATEACAGKYINLYFTPTQLGSFVGELTISSSEVSTTLPITAECAFDVLPVTNLTQTSATLNWTNAQVSDYTVDVYQKSTIGIAEQEILYDSCANTKGTTGGYTDVANGALRLGSGSKTGSLTFNSLNVATGGKVIVAAMYYGSDTDAQLAVTIGDVKDTFALTDAFTNYELTIPANEASTSVSLVINTLKSGKRAYIKSVRVVAGGEQEVITHVTGYPQSVGNVLSYNVTGLTDQTEYLFTITPTGYSASAENSFTTGLSTALDAASESVLCTYSLRGGFVVEGLQEGEMVRVYDAMGRLVDNRIASSTSEQFSLSVGVYLVQVNNTTGKAIVK